ncbi:MAG: ligase-associated DNA damage response exonuclease [Phycisphaerales bacterium]|nr:ligase-associated DNA damage response exonuclease [Phycisphaerales bacterium]
MPPPRDELLIPTDHGLWCAAGGFHIDPWKPVDRAVVTHAHSDHAVAGCGSYLCSPETAELLKAKFGPQTPVQPLQYSTPLAIGGVSLSLHPAGHILGSAQIRLQPTGAAAHAHGHAVWVVSGDYMARQGGGRGGGVGCAGASDEHAQTCRAFEPLRCEVFITESTFGLPIYRWRSHDEVMRDVNRWWTTNRAEGITSLLFGWALGKSQRILASLDDSIGPIAVHGALERFNEVYTRLGAKLPSILRSTSEQAKSLRGSGIVLAPPSADRSPWMRRFGDVSTAYATGWMQIRGTRRRRSAQRGFPLSDHSDWEGLLWAIEQTGASRVGVTHGYTEPLARWLREKGLESWIIPTRWEGEIAETGQGSSSAGEESPVAAGTERAADNGHEGSA